MNNLTSEQYQSILKYMQWANQENFEHACQIMIQYDFDMNNVTRNMPHNLNRMRSLSEEGQQQQNQKILKNYTDYLKNHRRKNKLFRNKLTSICFKIKQRFQRFPKIFCPCLVSIFFKTNFQKNYPNTQITYSTSLLDGVKLSKQNLKPCLVILSKNQKNLEINEFLNNNEVQFNTRFEIVGLVEDSKTRKIFEVQAPYIIICRKNITQQIEIIQKIEIYGKIIDYINEKKVNEIIKQFERLERLDNNIVRRFKNHIEMQLMSQDDPNELFLSSYQQNQENIEKNMIEVQTSRKIKQEQNIIYKQIQQQARNSRIKQQQKIKLEEKQRKKSLQLIQERNARKLSIPQEPLITDQNIDTIIQLNFRCPDGKTINRNFLKNQKVQLLYNWVETNDQIIFENQTERIFELLVSYPPTSLSEKKQKYISQAIQGNREKVIIQQL